MMGALGFTFLAAAISCSWFTSSVMDSRSSGSTFSMAPAAGARHAQGLRVPLPCPCRGYGPTEAPCFTDVTDFKSK